MVRLTRVVYAPVVALAIAAQPGCMSFWQSFRNNPVVQAQTVAAAAENALDLADLTWAAVRLRLSPELAAQGQAKYDQLVLVVRHALTALEDAAVAAQDAKAGPPDMARLIADVAQAVDDVGALLNDFRAPAGASGATADAAGASRQGELARAIAVVHRVAAR